MIDVGPHAPLDTFERDQHVELARALLSERNQRLIWIATTIPGDHWRDLGPVLLKFRRIDDDVLDGEVG